MDNYETFDFSKSNKIFGELQETVRALIPKTVGNNESVTENTNKMLIQMDEAGINDGNISEEYDIIDDDSENDKDLAAVSAAFKTIEVLGQILQNYPLSIRGEKKVEIIDEMHKLGMRTVQAIVCTMGYLEDNLAEFVYERAVRQGKNILKDDVVQRTHRFLNFLISSMAGAIVHQVAMSLNSEHLLLAAKNSFENDESISSKLVLLDLKLNGLKKIQYDEIKDLKHSFDDAHETFASLILDSIVGQYLNYNRCDYKLRSKLCKLCGFSEQQALINSQKID